MGESLLCQVYRCSTKPGMYIYLTEKDSFEVIPDALKKRLGKLDWSFEFELHESRKLNRHSPKEVMQKLNSDGFFLQLPPSDTTFVELDKHSDGF